MSNLIWTTDLTWMRTYQNTLLPGTAVIYRATFSSDGKGGQSESWAVIGTVDARLLPPAGEEKIAGEQITSVTEWFVTVPVGTDVTAKDRIKIDDTRIFEVEWINGANEWTHTAMRCRVKAMGEEAFRETQVAVATFEYQFDDNVNSFYLATV